MFFQSETTKNKRTIWALKVKLPYLIANINSDQVHNRLLKLVVESKVKRVPVKSDNDIETKKSD